jgi:hypothetical protein
MTDEKKETIGDDVADDAPTGAVGYGKPPLWTQFKKGCSGNPKGRPKKAKNLKTDLKELLNEPVTVKTGGVTKTVTKRRAMMMNLQAQALQGNTKATQAIINLALQLDPPEMEPDADMPSKEEDHKTVENYLAWHYKLKGGA